MASLIDTVVARLRRAVAPTETAGTMGTAIHGGMILEHEKNFELRDREKYRTYSNILANTTIVAAGVRYYLNLLQKAAWKVNPADDTPQAKEIAEAFDFFMRDMETPWSRIVRRAAMFKYYGFSVQEWTAKLNEDGTIGLLDIAPRAQITIEKWDVEEHGKIVGMIQRSPQTNLEIYLPRSKVLYLVDDSLNDSPEGLGIFRNLVEPSKRLQAYETLEGFGYETDLRGVPLGRVPFARLQEMVASNKMTQAEATAAADVMKDFIMNHIKKPDLGLIVDSAIYEAGGENQQPSSNKQWDLELMKSSGGSMEEINSAIERINHEIARLMGVESLLLGQSRGTQALSEDKSHNFAMVVDSSLTEIEEAVDKDIVVPLMELNGWDPELKPQLQTEQIQFKSPTQVTEALASLARAMLDPDDPAINVIREQLGLPNALVVRDVEDASLSESQGTPKPEEDDEDDEDDE